MISLMRKGGTNAELMRNSVLDNGRDCWISGVIRPTYPQTSLGLEGASVSNAERRNFPIGLSVLEASIRWSKRKESYAQLIHS